MHKLSYPFLWTNVRLLHSLSCEPNSLMWHIYSVLFWIFAIPVVIFDNIYVLFLIVVLFFIFSPIFVAITVNLLNISVVSIYLVLSKKGLSQRGWCLICKLTLGSQAHNNSHIQRTVTIALVSPAGTSFSFFLLTLLPQSFGRWFCDDCTTNDANILVYIWWPQIGYKAEDFLLHLSSLVLAEQLKQIGPPFYESDFHLDIPANFLQVHSMYSWMLDNLAFGSGVCNGLNFRVSFILYLSEYIIIA